MTRAPPVPIAAWAAACRVADGMPRGDPDHPANFGRLCSKGAALKDTLALPDRLTAPMVHGREASWDEALDLIAAEFDAHPRRARARRRSPSMSPASS